MHKKRQKNSPVLQFPKWAYDAVWWERVAEGSVHALWIAWVALIGYERELVLLSCETIFHKFIYINQPCPRSSSFSSFSLSSSCNSDLQSVELTHHSQGTYSRFHPLNRWVRFSFLFFSPFTSLLFRSAISFFDFVCLFVRYLLLSLDWILGLTMEPMDIVGKSKEDASLPKGISSFYVVLFDWIIS